MTRSRFQSATTFLACLAIAAVSLGNAPPPEDITTGGQDSLVPPHSVERLAAVLRQLDREVLLIRRDSGGHQTDYEDAVAILEFVIQQAKPLDATK